MRQRLLKPARERYRGRGGEHGAARKAHQAERQTAMQSQNWDLEAERVREAGGPVDLASYVCGCGYIFSAAVSTTVVCPNCGVDQAW
jgi:rubrerythrin